MPRQYYRSPAFHARVARQQEAGRAKAAAMAVLYRDGWTLQRIGAEYGITRERVRQLLQSFTDVSRKDGGRTVRSAAARAARQAKHDAKYIVKHGCTFAQWRSIPRKATYAFQNQRSRAAERGIGWDLTLWQWWTFWQESGRWQQRGRGQGYVMCRRGDVGPYAIGNIFIASALVNCSDKRTKKYSLPMGVRPAKSGKFTAHRMLNGKKRYLGSFSTPGQAYAAYLQAGHLNKLVSSEAA